MPFEAGIAYAMHAAGRPPHHLLLLEKQPYRHNASLSDAAGMDAKIHGGDPARAIEAVREFLHSKTGGTRRMPGGAKIAKRYALFEAKLPAAAKADSLTMKEVGSWRYVNDVQAIMAVWIRANPPPI